MKRMSFVHRAALAVGLAATSAATLPGAEAPPKRKPEVWAVVIGIDRYEDKTIPPCNGAILDAREVGQWFFRTAGWGRRNVLMLQESGAARPGPARDQASDLKPTRENLDWAIREWLGARVEPEDVVVIYFAGQAVGLPPPAGAVSGAPGREFLLPIDARAADVERSGWSIDEAIDVLASKGRNPIVCWLDTSLQGRGGRTPSIPGADPRAAGLPWLNKVARWPGVTAWLAADGLPAVEAKDVGGRSAFVSALLEALDRPRQADNLLACLDRMNRDPALRKQGFRTLGGVAPEVSLRAGSIRARVASGRELLLQRGHADRVAAVAFTADGGRMVTASWDSTVRIWRVADRVLLRALPEYFHYEGVAGLALSPDGRWLASGDGSGRLRVWDLVEGKEKLPTGSSPHTRRVTGLAFLPDGVHLVSLDQGGQAWLWDVSGPKLSGKVLAAGVGALACANLAGPVALATAGEDEPIRLFGPDGAPIRTLAAPEGGLVTSLALSADGRLLVAGDGDGRVTAWDVPEDRPTYRQNFAGAVHLLGLSPARALAVGTPRALHLAHLDREGPGRALEVSEPAAHASFSPDGLWLAACTKRTGGVHLWRVDDPDGPRPTPLADAGREAPAAVSIAFAPDGRSIVAGDQDGGIRAWDLPGGEARPGIPPRRGKIAGLSVSDDRRYLLQISRDWTAQVWDLRDGRGFAPIAGQWTSGVLAPDGSSLALTSLESGDLVLVDRETGRPRDVVFPRPPAEAGPGPVRRRFGANNVADGDQMVAISRDGRWVAACSPEGPLACVWDARTGRLAYTIRDPDHTRPIAALDLSADGRHLLTADAGGTAILWVLAGATDRPRRVAAFVVPGGEAIAAARIAPGNVRRIATGTRPGRLLLWEVGKDQPVATPVTLEGSVRALSFTPDGRWLAVAGADKSVRLVATDRPREVIRLDVDHPHAEQVNTLVAWPGSGLVASGSDDTTVRFWDLAGRALLGTLSAVQEPTRGRPGPEAAPAVDPSLETSWVAYTPEGLFDSSPGGERQVTWLRDGEVLPLEQFFASCHVFGLTDWLRQGKRPPAPKPPVNPPPRLSIDPPSRVALDDPDRTVELTISLAEAGLNDVRLYQNGVPVQGEAELGLDSGRRRLRTTVSLRRGTNRFYAMASRPGSIDGRSNEVEIRFDGQDNPPQLHVLALGVSRYERRALRFAHEDAQQIADFLQRHGVHGAGREGRRVVLTDDEVTSENVERELKAIQGRVKGRPQDMVVVFLAGHTDVLQDRFCLLLPKFPFPAGPGIVAARGAKPAPGGVPAAVDPKVVLPYARIYREIARLEALQRLVIIDACQSEAIFDDPGVRLVRRYIDEGAQLARTSYLLAARRGEPANEVAALRHGLLSYVLLKGMGSADLETVPEVKAFDGLANADLDGDGVVATEELRRFADRTLPSLAAHFPELVERAGADRRREIVRPAANLRQAPRIQAAGGRSFPLVELPEPAR